MPVIVVANPKGGVGKSTLSSNIAGYFARQGHSVMLGDIDRQQSSREWLGIRPFELRKDGWLYNLHFAEKGVTPVLAGPMPEDSRKTADARAHAGRAETVAWTYERPNGGRSFGFTGCDLHANWADANQRLLVLNGLLWTAKIEVPEGGLVSEVSEADLKKNWDRKVFLKKDKAKTK